MRSFSGVLLLLSGNVKTKLTKRWPGERRRTNELEHMLLFADRTANKTYCDFAKVITLKGQGHWSKWMAQLNSLTSNVLPSNTEIWPKIWVHKGHDLERSRSYVQTNSTIRFLDLKNIDLDTKIAILSDLVQTLRSMTFFFAKWWTA